MIAGAPLLVGSDKFSNYGDKESGGVWWWLCGVETQRKGRFMSKSR